MGERLLTMEKGLVEPLAEGAETTEAGYVWMAVFVRIYSSYLVLA